MKLSILICFSCAETNNCFEIFDQRLITAAYYYIFQYIIMFLLALISFKLAVTITYILLLQFASCLRETLAGPKISRTLALEDNFKLMKSVIFILFCSFLFSSINRVKFYLTLEYWVFQESIVCYNVNIDTCELILIHYDVSHWSVFVTWLSLGTHNFVVCYSLRTFSLDTDLLLLLRILQKLALRSQVSLKVSNCYVYPIGIYKVPLLIAANLQ